MQQHGHHTINDVVLEDGKFQENSCPKNEIIYTYVYVLDIDPPFSPRTVTVKKNKLVTDEYELMEILGR
jgi:hypothetical protein